MKKLSVAKGLPVVAIWWKDHASNDAWGAEPEGKLEEILAVGMLTYQDNEKVVIARAVGLSDSQFEGTLTIHVACITKLQRLWTSPARLLETKELKK